MVAWRQAIFLLALWGYYGPFIDVDKLSNLAMPVPLCLTLIIDVYAHIAAEYSVTDDGLCRT